MAENNRQDDINASRELASSARILTETLKDSIGLRSRLTEQQRAEVNLAKEVQRSAEQFTQELGNQGKIGRQLTKDRRTLQKLEREYGEDLKNNSKEIAQFVEYQDEILNIQKKLKTATAEERINLERNLEAAQELQNYAFQTLSTEGQKLAMASQSKAVMEETIAQREAELQTQKEINKKMGVAGAMVTGLGGLMERLGMRSGVFNDIMQETKEAMFEIAEGAVRNEKEISKAEVAMEGLKVFAERAAEALADPTIAISSVLSATMELDKAKETFIRDTGANLVTFENALHGTQNTLGDVLEVAQNLTDTLGVASASLFNSTQLNQLAEAKEMLGLSAQEVAGLALKSQVTGENINTITDNIIEGVNEGNRLSGSAVATGVAMRAVMTTSDSLKASFGDNTKELAKAVTQAKALGLELEDIDAIAGKLLEFESSIGSELEAQLITGKQLNLAKARELALSNDLGGLAKELANQGITAAEYASMNRIEQESIAEAFGMSRDQLGKSVMLQKSFNSLTDEQKKSITGMTREQLEYKNLQDRINDAIQKGVQFFTPLVDMLLSVTEKAWAFNTIMGATALTIGVQLSAAAAKAVVSTLSLIASIGKKILMLGADTAATNTNTASQEMNNAAKERAAVSSTRASFGLRSMGKALGAFGAAAASSIPVLLSIAAVAAGIGIAAAGIGFGFKMASDGVVNLMNNLSADKIKNVVGLTYAISGLATALGGLALAGIAALPALGALSLFKGSIATVSNNIAQADGRDDEVVKAIKELGKDIREMKIILNIDSEKVLDSAAKNYI